MTLYSKLGSALLCGAILAAPVQSVAHDGHAASPIAVDVVQTAVQDDGLAVTLQFFNSGHIPVEIATIGSELGPISGVSLPYYVLGGDTDILTAVLETDDPVPGIFTLFIDFGDLGAGPVLVMPDV